MTLRAKVVTGMRWTVGARLLAQVITWAVTLLVIRILTPADYGLLAMATVFVAFLAMISEFGLGTAIVQSPDVDVAILRKVLGIVMLIHALLLGMVVLAAPLIAGFFNEPRLEAIVQVLSLQFVLAAFAVVPGALLQRNLDFRRRSLLDLSGSIVGGATTLALALWGQGVWALVIGSLVAQAWRSVGINVIAPFAHWPTFAFSGLRTLMTFGGHTAASQVLWFIYTQADVVIAGRWLGKELVGFYTVAMHIASLPNQRISGIINQVAFPAFASIRHDIESIGKHLLLGVRVLGFVAFPALWGISSVAPEIVAVVLGSRWAPAALPLQVLGLVMPVRMIMSLVPNAVQGIGRTDILLRNAIFAVLVMPAAFLTGVQWGLLGLSLAWVVCVPILFVQNMLRTLPVLGLNFASFVLSMLPAAGAAAAMYAVVAIARLTIAPHVAEAALLLGILVVVGAVAYALSSLVLNRDGVREARELLVDMTRGRKRASGGE